MDSTCDRHPDRSSVVDEKGNPFVSFSRLVDQQISSFFRTFLDFPSSSVRSKSNSDSSSLDFIEQQRRWKEARQEGEALERAFNELFAPFQEKQMMEEEYPSRQHHKRDVEEQDSPMHRMAGQLRIQSQQDLQRRLQEEEKDLYAEYAEEEKYLACIRDRLFQGIPQLDDQEDEAMRNNLVPKLIWPIHCLGLPKSSSYNYLQESPYSPLQIVNQDLFRTHHANWKKAFEDLLLVSHGKELSAPHEEPEGSRNWQNSLLERGLIGWNPLGMTMVQEDEEGPATRQPESDASESAGTELDLYERLLGAGGQSTRSTAGTSTLPSDSSNGSRTASSKPNVISTLTTTQRQTLPDGSVHTKVVLKKRFSDGREESTETEHSTHSTQQPRLTQTSPQQVEKSGSPSRSVLGHDGKIKQALGQRIEERRKNGWFWS